MDGGSVEVAVAGETVVLAEVVRDLMKVLESVVEMILLISISSG